MDFVKAIKWRQKSIQKENEYITFVLGSVPFTFHLTFVLLLSSPIPFFNRVLMVASGVE